MGEGRWERVAPFDRLEADAPFGVYIDGADIAVYRLGEELFATAGICTHAFARLADGDIEGALVRCPLHQGTFDIRTGAATGPPCAEALATYEVKVEDGIVYVLL